MNVPITPGVEALIDLALEEDQVGLDVTSQAFFGNKERRRARILARQELVMAGGAVAETVFRRVDRRLEWTVKIDDGETAIDDEIVAVVEGPAASLLRAERVALNFLQRMCGVATFTKAHVQAVGDAEIRVVDTRKTLPGYRLLDKYSVRCGGGYNHRLSLAGGVMIKENHIEAAGSIAEAIRRVRAIAPHTVRVEVEVEHLDQVEEAVDEGAEVVLLDNMDNATMQKAVQIIRGHSRGNAVVIEASGNMDIERLATLSEVGVDVVSVGALTHSARAADLSMRLD